MRILAAAAVVVLCAAPAASAKFRIGLGISDATPAVGQRVTAVLSTEGAVDHDMRLIAVAPGKSWYDVVGVVTGDSRTAKATIPRDGFEVRVTRVAPNRWRARLRFPRPGRWRLVVPNFGPVGFAIPPPVVRTVAVSPRS